MYYLWEMYFSGGGSETTWLWFRAAGGSLHRSLKRSELQAGDGTKDGAVRGRGVFKVQTLWRRKSVNLKQLIQPTRNKEIRKTYTSLLTGTYILRNLMIQLLTSLSIGRRKNEIVLSSGDYLIP